MNFIKKLFDASNSTEDLTAFISSNSIEIYDFFISQKNSSIIIYRNDIEDFILPKYGIYNHLNFKDAKNQTFLFCLLDVSQRFGLSLEFQQVYYLAEQNDISLNSRLNASSKFLVGINSIDDYKNRIVPILADLSISFLEEEDNEQKTVATLIHFYTEVFNNFPHNIERVIEFKNELLEQLKKEEFNFLLTPSVDEVFSYSLNNVEELYQAVHTKLDEILERANQYLAFNIEPSLIESDTHYTELLAGVEASFKEIRNLCVRLYAVVANDDIFRSLQRGAKVLTEQNQLLAYLYSYGSMHQAKMLSAFNPIEQHDLQGELEIYDWGCGQGLASICFLEYLNEKEIDYSINKFTLIEPSEIAIKRASLHLRKYTVDAQIVTINKDLDSLEKNDFESNGNPTKIHLFSNILDIDQFSMNDLINTILQNFSGQNIFICSSPYVSHIKTERIDSFVQSFSDKLHFEIISKISEMTGEWIGTRWTRVIRVFKYTIE